MKRLTINRVARSSLKGGGSGLWGLMLALFLSIFLATSMALAIRGVSAAILEKNSHKMGYMDFYVVDNDITDERLMSEGDFDRLGHVYVTADIGDSGNWIGYADEEGEALMNYRATEGRLPERPGEIALGRRALEMLRWEGEIGEEITLSLIPPGGAAEERTFILTGVLAEHEIMSRQWERYTVGGQVYAFPAGLVSREEAPFSTGRVAAHRLMTLAPGRNAREVTLRWLTVKDEETGSARIGGPLVGDMMYVDRQAGTISFFGPDDEQYRLGGYLTMPLLLGLMMALALLVACGVGIAQAMEARLARRVEQIGMLRAVGATRRQIRRIFGREIWLLALIVAPLAVAVACGAVYGLSRLAPGEVIFTMDWRFVLAALVFSGGCVLLFARLPLRRASRILPMQVIRDTAVLRRMKRVKGKTRFVPATLIARRQARLYPSRQAGAAALVAAMLAMVASAFLAWGLNPAEEWEQRADFTVYTVDFTGGPYYDDIPAARVTEADLHQLEALPHVARVARLNSIGVMALKDDYRPGPRESEYLYTGQEPDSWFFDGGPLNRPTEESLAEARRIPRVLREILGTEKQVVQQTVRVLTLTEEEVDKLNEYVAEGRLDLKALDEGREVAVADPDLYLIRQNDGYQYWTYEEWWRSSGACELLETWTNDNWHVGEQLDLAQFVQEDAGNARVLRDATEGDLRSFYGSELTRCRAYPTVGALIKTGEMGWEEPFSHLSGQCILTTEKGAKAMGLRLGAVKRLWVYLDGDVDEETEEYLEERITAICARGGDYIVENNIRYARENRQAQARLMMVLMAMAVVFLAASVGMISGNAGRRVRADERTIGLLRAVGADRRVLLKCYLGQVLPGILIGLGVVLALLAALALFTLRAEDFPMTAFLPSLGGVAAFAGVCLACCCLALMKNVKDVTRRSVVENIREL